MVESDAIIKRKSTTDCFTKITKPGDIIDHEYSELLTEQANNEKPNYREDLENILLLSFLYVLQGVPMGLAGSIPMILQNKGASYAEQGKFSFHYWPFSLKLLWAPIVDSIYSHSFGRRKSWMIPAQYLLGLCMLISSYKMDDWLGESDGKLDTDNLLYIFFLMYFLAATQDIAVDGWALTILKEKNVCYASTCNSAGQSCGFFLGYVVFLALESPDFCNKYLRSEPQEFGIFVYFWGIIFLITTTLILFFKKENTSLKKEKNPLGIIHTYKALWDILKLHSIRQLIFALLTAKIAFAAVDGVTSLKLVEKGLPKEKMALLAVPLMPFQILFPLWMSKFIAGPRPLSLYMKAYPYRILIGWGFVFLVWSYNFWTVGTEVTWHFYAIILLLYVIHQFPSYAIFMSQMAFFNKISDPVLGGTYLTLMNTLANLGSSWPVTVFLWLVDPLTLKHCYGVEDFGSCKTEETAQNCDSLGGVCTVAFDGYYVCVVLTTVIGIVWCYYFQPIFSRLEVLPLQHWKCNLNV